MSVSAPVFARSFINREAEMTELLRLWNAAKSGSGALVFIEGEAGVGKSRLVSELRNAATKENGFAAVGRCLPYAMAPFAPIADVLRSTYQAEPVAAPPQAYLRTVLRSIVPEIGPPYEDLAASDAMKQRWMHDGIRDSVARLSAKTAALLLFEDLHWSDSATLCQFGVRSIGCI